MATVMSVVKDIIEEKPFLQEALASGIINNAALSEQLMPQIEKALKKKVKFSAVNMAIRRLSEKLLSNAPSNIRFEKSTDITVKSDLVGITIYKTKDTNKYVAELHAIVHYTDFLTVTQGLQEVMIMTNEKFMQEIMKIIPKQTIKKVIKDLCSLTINIPPESTKTLGLFYITTRAMTLENICIVDMVSTLTEMTFIVHEEDTSKAFDTLRGVIKQNS